MSTTDTELTVRGLDGGEAGTADLPGVFETPYRPDLIRKAVRVAQANRKQDYGADPRAGMRTTAESFGSGRGLAHVPRTQVPGAGSVGREVPQTVKGRRAHPPKAQKDRTLDMNDKARRTAVRSAIAATADRELVADRGHEFADAVEFPVVVDDAFEDLVKTQAAVGALEALGVHRDVERADEKRGRTAGRGSTRGRGKRTPASVLVVTSSEAGPSRAARNLCGATVTTAEEVNAEDLAPGGHPGRLTVYTESALAEVEQR